MKSVITWLFGVFNPLVSLAPPLIQPQERLRPGYLHRPVPADDNWDNIITGVYGKPPVLKIHDSQGMVKWKWSRDHLKQKLPNDIKKCLFSVANDATEVKWIRNGTAVAAIYSDTVLLINHTPHDERTDKKITFAACRQNSLLRNAHTMEMLPGNLLAVATTGQSASDGFVVYNASEHRPLVANPPVLQKVSGTRAIHGMIWDEMEQMLWATGTDHAADGSEKTPAYGVIQAYPFNVRTGKFQNEKVKPSSHLSNGTSKVMQNSNRSMNITTTTSTTIRFINGTSSSSRTTTTSSNNNDNNSGSKFRYRLSKAYDIEAEWGKGTWWAGPHDLVPVPNQRKFLISNDWDLYAFDIPSGQFTEKGDEVVHKYLRGFHATTYDRAGYSRGGRYVELPRSDVKCFSLAPDGSFLYIQSLWRQYRGNYTSIVVGGVKNEINQGDHIYRSRWYADIPGWPKPRN